MELREQVKEVVINKGGIAKSSDFVSAGIRAVDVVRLCMATGQSGQIELALPTVNAIKIPLPPFEKQREIADQIAAIEEKIQGLEAEIAGAEERKQAVLEKYLK